MLIVLAGAPVAAPPEAGLGEEAVAEVAAGDLVGEGLRAVAVYYGGGGLHVAGAVRAVLVVGIVERVDVDGQSAGMLRQRLTAGDGAVAEGRRVVVAHLRLVIGTVDVVPSFPGRACRACMPQIKRAASIHSRMVVYRFWKKSVCKGTK